MNKFKKALGAVMIMTLAATLLAGCGKKKDPKETYEDEEKIKIGIVTMRENSSFIDIKKGIINALNNNEYDSKSTTIEYMCADGDEEKLDSIVNTVEDEEYECVFTIGTPATQAFVNSEGDVPVFFCAVSSPIQSKILTDMEKPDMNATGVVDAIPVSEIIGLEKKVTKAKKIGLIYSGKEDNSTNTIKQVKEYLKSMKIKFAIQKAETGADVEKATRTLARKKVQAIFVPNDSIIQEEIEKIAEVCKEEKIATYCAAKSAVEKGCFACIAPDDKLMGEEVVKLALLHLEEEKEIKMIDCVTANITTCTINEDTMKSLGIKKKIKTSYNLEMIK